MGILTIIETKTLGTTQKVVLNRYSDGMVEFIPSGVTTGTLNSTTAVSAIVSTLGWVNGMPISGTGIQAGTTIVSFVANTSCVLSLAATASASGVTLTVDKRPVGRTPHRTELGNPSHGFVKRLFAALQLVA